MAEEFGADEVIHVGATSRDERVQTVYDRTTGCGGDVGIECVGYSELFRKDLR